MDEGSYDCFLKTLYINSEYIINSEGFWRLCEGFLKKTRGSDALRGFLMNVWVYEYHGANITDTTGTFRRSYITRYLYDQPSMTLVQVNARHLFEQVLVGSKLKVPQHLMFLSIVIWTGTHCTIWYIQLVWFFKNGACKHWNLNYVMKWNSNMYYMD